METNERTIISEIKYFLNQTQKCPLELRFMKVVGSTKLRGTPLQTWYYIYRHLLMTTEMKSYTVVKDIRCILKLDLWPPQG